MLLPAPPGPALSRFPTERAATPDPLKWPWVKGCVPGAMLSPAQRGRQPDGGSPPGKHRGTPIPNQSSLPWATPQPDQGGCWRAAGSGGCLFPPTSICLVLLTWEHLRAAQAFILPAWQSPIRGGSAVALETPVAITAADGGRWWQRGDRMAGGGDDTQGAARSEPSLERVPTPFPKSSPGWQNGSARLGGGDRWLCHLRRTLSHFVPPSPAATVPRDQPDALPTSLPSTLSHNPCTPLPKAELPVHAARRLPGITPGQPSQPRCPKRSAVEQEDAQKPQRIPGSAPCP